MHLPLPLHKSGQPSGWRNGEDEKEGHEATLGQQGSHAKGNKVTGQLLGQPQSEACACLQKSWGSRQCMQLQDIVESQMQGIPNVTDLYEGV